MSLESRAGKYNQKSALILVTGEKNSGKKSFAKKLEATLFEEGRIVYFLGIGNVPYGINADMRGKGNHRIEHILRLAEVAQLLLDAGIILIVTAIELTQDDFEIIKTAIDPEQIEVIWVGDRVTTDIECDLIIEDNCNTDEQVSRVLSVMHEKGIIFC